MLTYVALVVDGKMKLRTSLRLNVLRFLLPSLSSREFANVLTQGSNHRFRFFAGHLDQHGKARMAFYQCRNVAVLSADQQITFPMTGNRAIFRFRGSFADGDSVDDRTARLSAG